MKVIKNIKQGKLQLTMDAFEYYNHLREQGWDFSSIMIHLFSEYTIMLSCVNDYPWKDEDTDWLLVLEALFPGETITNEHLQCDT